MEKFNTFYDLEGCTHGAARPFPSPEFAAGSSKVPSTRSKKWKNVRTGKNELTACSSKVPTTRSRKCKNIRTDQNSAAEEVSECCNYVFVQETDIKKAVWVKGYLHHLFYTLAGDDIKKMIQRHPHISVVFMKERNKIEIEGPPDEVNSAQWILTGITKNIQATEVSEDVKFDENFRYQIVGYKGANINRLQDKTGTSIFFPSVSKPGVIRIRGRPKQVADAKRAILEMTDISQ